jgi:hypothetical protein
MTISTLTSLTVAVHLLSMAGFVAAFFVQRAVAPGGQLVTLWPWSVLFISLSGFALVILAVTGEDHLTTWKMVAKGTMMTVLGVTVLVLYFRRRPASRGVVTGFGILVLAEVAVSVLIS